MNQLKIFLLFLMCASILNGMEQKSQTVQTNQYLIKESNYLQAVIDELDASPREFSLPYNVLLTMGSREFLSNPKETIKNLTITKENLREILVNLELANYLEMPEILDELASLLAKFFEENYDDKEIVKLYSILTLDLQRKIISVLPSFTYYLTRFISINWSAEEFAFVSQPIFDTLREHNYFLTLIEDANKLVSTCKSAQADFRVFDPQTGKCLFKSNIKRPLSIINISKDNQWFYSDTNGTIEIVYKSKKTITIKNAHASKVKHIAVSSDGKQFYSCTGSDNIIKKWDIGTQTCISSFVAPAKVTSLALSKDNNFLIVACENKIIQIFNMRPDNKAVKDKIINSNGDVSALAITSDNRFLLFADGICIKIFDLTKDLFIDQWCTYGFIYSLVLMPDNNKLFSYGSDNVILVWDIKILKLYEYLLAQVSFAQIAFLFKNYYMTANAKDYAAFMSSLPKEYAKEYKTLKYFKEDCCHII